jgi:CheY-like chemotaxis protein
MSRDTMQVPLRILLIDDDPDHVLLIRRALRDLGNERTVDAISDGEQALERLQSAEKSPDLILLDINMPGYSGFDVLVQIRRDERLKCIPVVMLTSSDTQSDITRAYELGASGYIAKPSHYQDLRAVLGNTVLYWSAMQRYAAPQRETGELM